MVVVMVGMVVMVLMKKSDKRLSLDNVEAFGSRDIVQRNLGTHLTHLLAECDFLKDPI